MQGHDIDAFGIGTNLVRLLARYPRRELCTDNCACVTGDMPGPACIGHGVQVG